MMNVLTQMEAVNTSVPTWMEAMNAHATRDLFSAAMEEVVQVFRSCYACIQVIIIFPYCLCMCLLCSKCPHEGQVIFT